jgi:hypothetical protein
VKLIRAQCPAALELVEGCRGRHHLLKSVQDADPLWLRDPPASKPSSAASSWTAALISDPPDVPWYCNPTS